MPFDFCIMCKFWGIYLSLSIYIYILKIIAKNKHGPGCLITGFCSNDQAYFRSSQENRTQGQRR